MTAQVTDDPGRLDRERRDADARYNEALTALDTVVVATSGRELSREDFDRAATALLRFLQQITAFVESKDRQLAFDAHARLDMLAQALEPIAELRTKVGVLQRDAKSTVVSRQSSVVSPQSSVVSPQASAVIRSPQSAVRIPKALSPQPTTTSTSASKIEFRGSDAAIEQRLLRVRADLRGLRGRARHRLRARRDAHRARRRPASVRAASTATAPWSAIACGRGLDAVRADALDVSRARSPTNRSAGSSPRR